MSRRQILMKVQESNGISIVAAAGAVDSATVHEFEDVLGKVCAAAGAKVVLDCAQLTHINSTTFALLNQFHRACESSGGFLAISGLNENILDIIELLGLDETLNLYETRRQAIAAAGGTASVGHEQEG